MGYTRSIFVLLLFLLLLAAAGAASAQEIKNADIRERVRSDLITFEPPPGLAAELRPRLVLGKLFFTSPNRLVFLKALEKIDPDEKILIGWYDQKNQRFVGPPFSRTRWAITKMSEQEFEEYRASWNEPQERLMCRYYCPGRKLSEAAKGELAAMRALHSAKSREEFLKQAAKAGAAYVVVAHLEKAGKGLHHYAIPVAEVRGLTEAQFHSWRKRFLRWIEAHTPGQSRVDWMAKLSDADFDKELREHRQKFRSVVFQYQKWQGPFFDRWGVRIQQPDPEKMAPIVVTEVRDGSAAAAAELQRGDQISQVESQAPKEWQDLPFVLESYQPGTKLRLAIAQGKQTREGWITVP